MHSPYNREGTDLCARRVVTRDRGMEWHTVWEGSGCRRVVVVTISRRVSMHRSSRRKHRSKHHFYTEQLIVLVLPARDRLTSTTFIARTLYRFLPVPLLALWRRPNSRNSSCQHSPPRPTKRHSENRTILVSKFDEILQKAAALAVSLVVAAKPEFIKITKPDSTSSDDSAQTDARTALKTEKGKNHDRVIMVLHSNRLARSSSHTDRLLPCWIMDYASTSNV